MAGLYSRPAPDQAALRRLLSGCPRPQSIRVATFDIGEHGRPVHGAPILPCRRLPQASATNSLDPRWPPGRRLCYSEAPLSACCCPAAAPAARPAPGPPQAAPGLGQSGWPPCFSTWEPAGRLADDLLHERSLGDDLLAAVHACDQG